MYTQAISQLNMTLTTAQIDTMRTVVQNEPSLAQAIIDKADNLIAAWCNTEASPAYVVWKTKVSDKDIMVSSGFDWTRVDNLSVGKARIWDWLFRFGYINPNDTNVRAAIDATWVGTAADLAVRAAVYTQCRRNATNLEKALATGLGTAVSPSIAGYEGEIGYNVAGLFRI